MDKHHIDTPCPHCGRDTVDVIEVIAGSMHTVTCSWVDCQYSVSIEGNLDTATRFAHKRIDKEKAKIRSLLRDAFHIVNTGEIVPDPKTVSDRSIALFKHKCEEIFGEGG